ncbi:MAG: DUF2807 domain-containing protein [Aquisalinus sp.]|nr:DUF2807 domain-containing protein [Aquisalinus sp.]
MLMRFSAALAALMVLMMAPAATAKDRLDFTEGTALSLPTLTGIAVKGGGSVTISPGNSYSVTVVEGGEKVVLFLEGDALQIECARPCRGNINREIEVTAPADGAMTNVAVAGGGSIMFADGFDSVSELNAAVVGGGSLRAFNLEAGDVNAAVTGGGSLQVNVTGDLSAAIVGGGSIVYEGNPTDISRSTIGGGSISPR